ncbi:response regulator [Seleniivibrio sp.]|uniref:response regulator n=1 Tax=Seleniivibrio sp. TaxID=2898801 RepID=UPI0025F2454E|nr:response regulator [Seleniivibrio sp.]MCD8554949.1 HDOD domain-containing protein [Seleniivibrio sp.]
MEKQGTILIVDDEQNILNSMRRLFMNHDIEVLTANSSQQAVELLASNKVDFFLCDYRMPDINGIQLLESVKDTYPDMFRAVISGYAEPDAMTYAIGKGTAMAYFKKPWTDYDLVGKVMHVLTTMRQIKDKEIIRIFSSINKLPSIPRIYYELDDAVNSGESIDHIASIFKRDASLTAKILQIGNSVFYSGKGSATLEQAILMIGLNTVKEIVLMYKLSEGLGAGPRIEKELARIFSHGLVLNKAVEHYLVHSGQKYNRQISNTLGVISCIGKIILLSYHPDRYYGTTAFSEGCGLSFEEAETEMGHITDSSAAITCSFLDLYNIPFEILEIILYVGRPEKVSEENRVIAAAYSAMVKIAAALENGESVDDMFIDKCIYGILNKEKLNNTTYIMSEVWNIGK